jgi:hypothetical protein
MPRLGEKYGVDIEMVSRSRADYQTPEYKDSGLPVAPALMVEDEIVAQGPEISEEKIEAAIRRHLGMPALA